MFEKFKKEKEEGDKTMFYIRARLGKDRREVVVGPYSKLEDRTLAVQKLEDAGEHGQLFDDASVSFETFLSEDPDIEAVDEREFLDIAGAEAPYQTG